MNPLNKNLNRALHVYLVQATIILVVCFNSLWKLNKIHDIHIRQNTEQIPVLRLTICNTIEVKVSRQYPIQIQYLIPYPISHPNPNLTPTWHYSKPRSSIRYSFRFRFVFLFPIWSNSQFPILLSLYIPFLIQNAKIAFYFYLFNFQYIHTYNAYMPTYPRKKYLS
jgi:hypothetical protein